LFKLNPESHIAVFSGRGLRRPEALYPHFIGYLTSNLHPKLVTEEPVRAIFWAIVPNREDETGPDFGASRHVSLMRLYGIHSLSLAETAELKYE